MTYTVHAFDTRKPALYIEQCQPVQAGNVRAARSQVASRVKGTVRDNVVYGPDGIGYDVVRER
jgi:hypothetical protein